PFLHGAWEGTSTFQLQRHVFSDKLSIEVWAPHLMDIDIGIAVGQFGDLFLQLFDFGALFADDDSRASCVNVYLCFVSCSFDFDSRDAGVVEAALQKFFDPKVFMKQLRIVMTSKPLRVPSLDYA